MRRRIKQGLIHNPYLHTLIQFSFAIICSYKKLHCVSSLQPDACPFFQLINGCIRIKPLTLFNLSPCLCPCKSFLQQRIAFCYRDILYSISQSLLRSYYHEHLLCSGDARINEIPLEHHEMVHHYRHHYYRIFRSLGFVNSCGIGVST